MIRVWDPTVSGYRFWLGYLILGSYSLGLPILELGICSPPGILESRILESGILESGILQSRATHFGAGDVLIG